jgi:tetraacyldisaccharide 4'-kinase
MAGSPRPTVENKLVRAWTHRGWLAWLLWPISLLFGLLVRFRHLLYRAGVFKVNRVGVPVIVVGNVVAGGSGKTPVVMALMKHLQARGLKPGVVSRGYGRSTTDCREVRVDSPASEAGDEPALIKRALSGTSVVPVFVGRSRFEAASALLQKYPQTGVIVCDDGLQHLALHRDIDICTFDDRGVGNGFMLPAGPLREPWPRPVDLLLHTGTNPAFADGFRASRALGPHALQSDGTSIALTALASAVGAPLLALAAIAQPEAFFAMLRAQGLQLSKTLALPDHYDFDSWSRPSDKTYTLICTEKDAVKLWPDHPDALAVPLMFTPEPAFMQALDKLLDALHQKLSLPHGHTTS